MLLFSSCEEKVYTKQSSDLQRRKLEKNIKFLLKAWTTETKKRIIIQLIFKFEF